MSKLLLLASMIAMLALPIRAAWYANPHQGLKRALYTALLFNIGWAVVVLVLMAVLLRDPAQLMPEGVNQ